MQLRVLAFGVARDIMGSSNVLVPFPGATATVGQLKKKLLQKYPPLKDLASFMVAVNDSYADDDESIKPTDEIAIIPPVSGG